MKLFLCPGYHRSEMYPFIYTPVAALFVLWFNVQVWRNSEIETYEWKETEELTIKKKISQGIRKLSVSVVSWKVAFRMKCAWRLLLSTAVQRSTTSVQDYMLRGSAGRCRWSDLSFPARQPGRVDMTYFSSPSSRLMSVFPFSPLQWKWRILALNTGKIQRSRFRRSWRASQNLTVSVLEFHFLLLLLYKQCVHCVCSLNIWMEPIYC